MGAPLAVTCNVVCRELCVHNYFNLELHVKVRAAQKMCSMRLWSGSPALPPAWWQDKKITPFQPAWLIRWQEPKGDPMLGFGRDYIPR